MSKTILIVDDSAINRRILSNILAADYSVIEAEDGRGALSALHQSHRIISAILLDIQMPVMDGYQAARAIRALNRADARTVPILALTANAFATDIGKAHSAGMNGHVAKPIEMDRLMETMQRWIR